MEQKRSFQHSNRGWNHRNRIHGGAFRAPDRVVCERVLEKLV